jgi:hypothetical protein
MKVYAIREKGTDKYLPQLKNKRGYSHYEPLPNGGKLGPRLFMSRHAATVALTVWKKGKVEAVIYDGEHDHNKTVPVPGRKGLEMEVVEFVLIESAKLEVPKGIPCTSLQGFAA